MRVSGCAALLLVHAFAAASASVPLPFHLTPQGAIIVPVIVNGTTRTDFLLDTGSNGSVISEELASSIGANIVARTTMVSAAGRKDALVAGIEHIAIGDVMATGLLMTIESSDALQLPDVVASGRKVQGVIGQDVLAQRCYTIDYRKREIVWHDVSSTIPAGGTVLDLEPQDDRFVVVLPQDRSVLRLVPDSGAETLVLFRGGGAAREVAMASGSIGVTSLSGTQSAERAVVRALRVGPRILKNVPAAIVTRRSDTPASDGLLPLHVFARVTFNGPERQLVIE